MKATLLVVDDEKDNVDALERLFRKKYNVLKATSGQEALQILKSTQEEIGVILTDQRMPQLSGADFLAQTISSHPDTIRLLLTGYTDIESVISAINTGQIYRYLTKPWDPADLTLTIDQAFERYHIGQELKKKNAELQKAFQELQTLDSAKSHFMILINHELKTPLTSILNYNGLLAESQLDDDQKLYVQRVNSSALRLKNLVDDVLLIMKSETGQLKLDVQSLSLSSLEGITNPEIEKMAQSKSLKITTDFTDQNFMADRRLLHQILQRLLHNACKFCEANSEILLHSEHKLDSIRFSVQNQGAEIPNDVKEKILKPFFINENAMNHSVGTGLGLTVCESLLKLHHSGLKIENQKNKVLISFDLKAN